MKIVVIALGILLATALFVYFWGSALPATQKVSLEISVNAPASRVWETMTAWIDQPQWRNGIERVEIVGSDRFIEYPKRGVPITFRVLRSEAPRRLELNMSGAVTGAYLAELFEENGATKIRVAERINIENPFMRAANKLFFNLESFAKEYLIELKFHVEKNI